WNNPQLRLYLPETKRYSRNNLEFFLNRHPVIYVKRVIGYIGHGVVRIERHGDKYRWISADKQAWLSRTGLLRQMERWVKQRKYIIQQGIRLASYKENTFDIRVSVQKNEEQQWAISGMVAKVAN